MTKRGKWPGTWATICDRCGFRFPSDQLLKEWDNLMVCDECFETRHPQDFLRGVPDNPAPPWTRPEPEATFIIVCDISTSSGYAGLGTAGCMQAGNTAFSYAQLVDINNGF